MKYCTNCGKESKSKICHECGAKRNSIHKYCAFCGNKIDENAVICTNCNERTKPTVLSRILSVINILLVAILAFCAVMSIIDGGIKAAIFFVVGIVLLLPFMQKITQKITTKKALRTFMNSARIFIVVILFSIGCGEAPEPSRTVNPVPSKTAATNAAVEYFHTRVKLKNESSFVLNDSKVTYIDGPYNGDENLRDVTVILDYSAQNGYGGMNRENYTVKLVYNIARNTYVAYEAYQ